MAADADECVLGGADQSRPENERDLHLEVAVGVENPAGPRPDRQRVGRAALDAEGGIAFR